MTSSLQRWCARARARACEVAGAAWLSSLALALPVVPSTGLAAQAGAVVAAPATAGPDAGRDGEEAADERRFDVLEFRVLGNRSLDAAAVEAAVYPHLGPQRGIADVEAARTQLEQAYRSAGFGTVYVDIPEQDVEGGIVRLQVTEGVLRRVRVEGARWFSARRIRAAVPAATPGRAPALPEVQQQLAALNSQTPDRAVVPVLAAGSAPGTVDLTLKVRDELPLHASIEVNDQYTPDTTRLRAALSLSYDNLFDRLDSLALQYQVAPQEPSELGVLVASYTARVGGRGQRLTAYYVDSDTDVATIGGIAVLGRGQIYGARFVMPLVATQAASHSLTLGADFKDFLETVRLGATDDFETPVSYVNLSLSQSSVWRDRGRVWTLGATLNVGPRRLGNGDGEFADKRFRGRPNYFFVRVDGSLTLPVFGAWSAYARLAGQYAVEPLISNEQFGVGGADGVRGYYESEELGDVGFKATLELRAPRWRLGEDRASLEAFAFADFGNVATLAPLPGEARRADLSSLGLGVNVGIGEHVEGALSWAYPLVPGARTLDGESRLHFSVRSTW